MRAKDAIIHILDTAGVPLHAHEITQRILKANLWPTAGKTPAATISARIYEDIKQHGQQSVFIQTAARTFALRDGRPTPEHKPKARNTRPLARPKATYSFLDAAEKVLDQFAHRQPMHYRNITDKALSKGWLRSTGKTPEATMNAQLVTELKRAKTHGESGRFMRTAPGQYSLIKWMGVGVPQQIAKHNSEIRKKRLNQVMALNPAQFEDLIGQLLAEMGFESIEVTKSQGDGGIDVRGILLISDAVRIKMAVQAKRWKNNIQRPTVQQVRGSLGVHEQGLIITTSHFSTGAIQEAQKPDKTPVGLMNGQQLVTLLMEYNLGVHRASYDLFELTDSLSTEKP